MSETGAIAGCGRIRRPGAGRLPPAPRTPAPPYGRSARRPVPGRRPAAVPGALVGALRRRRARRRRHRPPDERRPTAAQGQGRVGAAWTRADLDAAAKALAERAGVTELSGGAIVRYAVGLEGGSLGGSVAGRRQRLGRRPGPGRHDRPAPAHRAPPTASSVSSATTRPRRPAGWPSWTGPGWAAAWPWTWAWARRRPCSPTSSSPGATAPSW